MVNEIADPGLLPGLERTQQSGTARTLHVEKPSRANKFGAFLDEALADRSQLRFSAHAQRRLQLRGIELSGDDLSRLCKAVGQAEAKGSRESLVLMDDLAAIVSIKNRMVVTVLDTNDEKENVFTNIDSTVVVRR